MAVELISKALSIKPDFAEAHSNLGLALKGQGKLDAAVECYRKALSIKPDYAEAHNNLGLALNDQGKPDAAVESYRKALSIKPDYAEAHNNLGITLQEQGKLDAAVASYRRVLSIKPDHVEAHNNLGTALKDQGRLDDAVGCYRKSLSIKPDYAAAHNNYLMTAQYGTRHSPAELLADHLDFGKRFEAPLRASWPSHDNDRDPQRRLRVGFVSGDLCAHPVGFFLESVLAHLDPKELDIVLYPTHSHIDALTKRLQGMGFAWESMVGLSDEHAAQRIREDAIDILVDLSGHTCHNRLRLFARKPAPVQVTWLGYPATTGLQAMDYIFCDRYGVPANESHHFVEKPWYLPNTYLCLTPPQDEIAVAALPALTMGRVTFGSFNNLTKMNDAVVALWAQVLHAVPGSRLFLKTKQLNDTSMQRNTLSRFAARGIAANRLALEGGTSSRADHLATYNRVDMALDPFPYNGVTTSVECLWMGVPVITKRGDRFIARQGESILHNVGLPDWIAADHEAYVAIAVTRATDLSGLAALRATLRSRLLASPLCDAPVFARNFEAAFRGMWQIYCSQEHKAKLVTTPMGASAGEAGAG
jgi:predicted O-linked N-acetylglucosamine transferase (SPINDLY family)